MKEYLQAFWLLWRKVSRINITADQRVALGPGYLISAKLSAGSGGAATAVIYDGHGTGEDVLIPLAAPTSGSDNFTPALPVCFNKGLYVDVGNNVTGVFLQFIGKAE